MTLTQASIIIILGAVAIIYIFINPLFTLLFLIIISIIAAIFKVNNKIREEEIKKKIYEEMKKNKKNT